MKLGTYSKLSSQLLGLALVWSSTACGIRSTLLQEDDAGVVTEDEGAQSSSTSSGGRSGTSTTPRAGRSGSGARGMAGAGQAMAGRAARAGRGGNTERAGAGGAGGRNAAAGSGDDKRDDDKQNEPQGGAGGEQAGSGGETVEQAGTGGEQAGAGGEPSEIAGMDAAGSGGQSGEGGEGGQAGEPAEQAGTGGAPAPAPGSLSQLTPEQVTMLCSNIDMATAGLPWGDGIRGYCSRRGQSQPEMCSTLRDMCVDGPEITPACAQTIPDCPSITITEYQRCRIDTLYRFVEDNRMITCETMPPLPEPSAVQSCDVIYDRCPAARALRVL
ncbi:MAG TPA: hypothetical protein VFN67_17055 [Polyangiales bacterium]|nr:hypothetical protein [Polyangiales bacterium]